MTYLDPESWPEGEVPVFISREEARALARGVAACTLAANVDHERSEKYNRAEVVLRNLLQMGYRQLQRAQPEDRT